LSKEIEASGRLKMPSKPQIANIEAWAKRRGRNSSSSLVISKLGDFKRLWEARSSDEFADFVPIRLVTLIESFMQAAIEELVDHGQPYLERSGEIIKYKKIDFEYIQAISGKKITVGALIAHAISINNFDQILSTLKNILGNEFRCNLEAVHDRWAVEISGDAQTPIISDFSTMAQNLSRLFQVRHILVHEIPAEQPYKSDEIEGFFTACGEFLSAVDQIVATELRGHYGRVPGRVGGPKWFTQRRTVS
jgi:hypothetical protein